MAPIGGMLVLWLWRLPSQSFCSEMSRHSVGQRAVDTAARRPVLRIVPTFHIALLDDLIRPPQQRRRDREAEGLGGLEVDHQLELRGLLYGEIGRLRALEDLVHVSGGATPLVRQT